MEMKNINASVRRQDRLLDDERAIELLRESEYGVLSMVSEGEGYGIPVNYVWDGKNSIFIHCAPEGYPGKSQCVTLYYRKRPSFAKELHY